MPDEPEVAGLLALMLLQDSRRDARTGPDGELVLLDEQDRRLWDREQIAEGLELVERLPSRAVRAPGGDRRRARAGGDSGGDRLGADRRSLRPPRPGRARAGRGAEPRRRGGDGRGRGARPRAHGRARRRARRATTCCTPRAPTCCAGSAGTTRPPPPTAGRSSSRASRPSGRSSSAASPRWRSRNHPLQVADLERRGHHLARERARRRSPRAASRRRRRARRAPS